MKELRMNGSYQDLGLRRALENRFACQVAFLTLQQEQDLVTICGKCDNKKTRDRIIQWVLNVQGVSRVDAAGLLT